MRYYFKKKKETLPLPDLTSFQKQSYAWFREKGIGEVLEEINPIEDQTGRGWELSFGHPRFEECEVTPQEAIKRGLTYSLPWYLTVTLKETRTGKENSREIFMGDFPEMTSKGTFVVNGIERVVVGQLTRSEGVYFTGAVDPRTGNFLTEGKIIPKNGAWLEFSTTRSNTLRVSVNRSRKMPITTLLRIFGLERDEEILAAFADVDNNPERLFLASTLAEDRSKDYEGAVLEAYRRIRPGERLVLANAKEVLHGMFFDYHHFDLGRVGRFKLNQELGLDLSLDGPSRLITKDDLVQVVRRVIDLNNGRGEFTDIDSLANRRVRGVGELAQHYLRVGFLQMARNIRGRMSVQQRGKFPSAKDLVSPRPVAARLHSFFASSQLSQYHDQNNPLSFLSHLRQLTVKGPGGLTQERASFSVRDAHYSHYGRICPVETPEGQNIGLTTHLALYARIDEFGFLETPLRRVIKDKKGSRVTDEVDYLPQWEENQHFIAPTSAEVDDEGYILDSLVPLRKAGEFFMGVRDLAEYMDITPAQVVGASTSTIPFLANDDSNRALMAANMSRQAVPLIVPQAPIVGTGMEGPLACNSGAMVLAEAPGEVIEVDAAKIIVKERRGKKEYELSKFVRSNDDTSLNQLPRVAVGDKVKAGAVLADGPSTEEGELALGSNLMVAYMPFEGLNYEDAFVVSKRLVEEDLLTSIHISEYTTSVLETKLGPEEITRDIPNVSEETLRNLDEQGIVAIGSEVRSGDILVGKIAPKGESELSAEERLLRSIFGEKARDVRDNSLRVPHGEYGTVIDVRILTPEDSDLEAGVLKHIAVRVAQRKKLMVGDKLAGRHGNKGVISAILPQEDMPFLADGTPVDMIVSPSSVISRMNIGQLFEAHLGAAGKVLGKKYAVPPLSKFAPEWLEEELRLAGLPVNGKRVLFDGKTGMRYAQEIVVGQLYALKLEHLVEEKIHARSTGPYTLITQQPLGGKSQFGGQRFGEMEVWALEAYGARENLQEMLTVKSDDIIGRSRAYKALIQGEEIPDATLPESFKLLIRELNGLGLEIEPLVDESQKSELGSFESEIEELAEGN